MAMARTISATCWRISNAPINSSRRPSRRSSSPRPGVLPRHGRRAQSHPHSGSVNTVQITSRVIRSTVVVSAALLAACSGGELVAVVPTPPVVKSGTATVSMSAAPAGLAAVRMRVTGSGVSAPVAGVGVRILLQSTVADTSVFVLSVSGAAPAQLLTLAVANSEQPVAAVVEEATSGRNAGYVALRATDVTVAVARQ